MPAADRGRDVEPDAATGHRRLVGERLPAQRWRPDDGGDVGRPRRRQGRQLERRDLPLAQGPGVRPVSGSPSPRSRRARDVACPGRRPRSCPARCARLAPAAGRRPRRARGLPRVYPRLTRRVHRRQGAVRPNPQRMGQRPQRVLPRRRATGRDGDHRFRGACPGRRGPPHVRRSRGGARRDRCGRRRAPAPQRGRAGARPRALRRRARAAGGRREGGAALMRAIVGGLMGSFPLGGVAWDYGQYVLGLHRLGFEVTYLEDTGWMAYDPESQEDVESFATGARFVDASLRRLDPALAGRFHIREMDGTTHGILPAELDELIATCDVFLNVSGAVLLREEYLPARNKVLVDTDPGWNHFHRFPQQQELRKSRGQPGLEAHDHFLTYAERLGTRGCTLPTLGWDWQPTRPPVVLDQWAPEGEAERWTTVMMW